MSEDQNYLPSDGTIPNPVGYEFGEPDAATTEALIRLLEYIRRLRRTGAETRNWTRHTRAKLDETLDALGRGNERYLGESRLADLAAWENHILQIVRHYMQEASDTINRIKTLNPPLAANQLRPFIQAVEADRAQTIVALEPLTKTLEQLSHYKRSHTSPARQT